MKQLIFDLYWDAKNDLERMQKSKMSIADRVAYEKALVRFDTIKRILNTCEIIQKS